MAYERKDMTGSVFRNDRKTQPTHSDFNGSVLIEGKEYWMNMWAKKDKNDRTYFSVSLKPKQPKTELDSEFAASKSKPTILSDELDDKIPF